jgi:integrase
VADKYGHMVEDAFRTTGLNINPHMLRHTGATHMLWNYCQLHQIEPDVRMASLFQEILQEQLGHADLETTRKYIQTLVKLKARQSMPFIIPANKVELDERLAAKIRTEISSQMSRFFEFRVDNQAT